MRFKFSLVNQLEDATANFEQIQIAFGVPVLSAAPSNPTPGQMYWDSTKDAAGLAALGYWGPVNGWRYV